jgi:hypothetical protein
MANDKVREALKAAASFKARGIKKAALGVVAEYEAKKAKDYDDINGSKDKCADCGVKSGKPHKESCNGGLHDIKSKKAAPGDPIQRDQPAAQADPAIPDPTAQPAAPVAPPVEEVEEAEETPEAKAARVREALETELGDDDLVTAVLEFLEAEKFDYDDYSVDVTDNSDGTATVAGYIIAPNDDIPESIALAQVRSDLESEPELFNQDWLQGHIDEVRLRDHLYSDTEEMIRDSPDSYGWVPGGGEELVRFNAEGEEEDDGEYDSAGEPIVEETEPSDDWLEEKTNELLRYPVQYLTDMLGEEDGIKQAISIAGIDINAAAEEAVAADGWQHFLSRYDGNSYDLASGGVYWREN